MVAINNHSYINPEINVDGTQNVQDPAAPQGAGPVAPATHAPLSPAGIENSSFEGIKPSSSSNVLNTAPPALGGGQTDPVSEAEAMGRAQQLQNSEPFRNGLVRASEDGTAPAVPKKEGVTIGSSSPAAPQQPTVAKPDAAAETSKPSTGGPSAPAPETPAPTSSSNPDVVKEVDQSVNANVTDFGKVDKDMMAEAKSITEGSTKYENQGCRKNVKVGQDDLSKRMQKMGLNKTQGDLLSRFLNSRNTAANTHHNYKDQQTVILALVAYDKLNAKGDKEGAQKIVDQLKTLANQFEGKTTDNAKKEGYYKAINLLGSYAIAASAGTALSSIQEPSKRKLVAYDSIGDL